MTIRYIRPATRGDVQVFVVHDDNGQILTEENTRAQAFAYLEETLDPAAGIVVCSVEAIFSVESTRSDHE